MAAPSLVYDKYSLHDVFFNKHHNIICNQIMQGLLKKDFVDFNDHFGLTGDAGNCLLNDLSGPITNIQFATDDREIFVYIANFLREITDNLLSLRAYDDRIVSEYEGAFIEFYFLPAITTTEFKGIYIVD